MGVVILWMVLLKKMYLFGEDFFFCINKNKYKKMGRKYVL